MAGLDVYALLTKRRLRRRWLGRLFTVGDGVSSYAYSALCFLTS
jgi:hypothetical protein